MAYKVARPPCQLTQIAVILCTFDLRRVRLVVRTQPSQGWCTGSTPVRAANHVPGDFRVVVQLAAILV